MGERRIDMGNIITILKKERIRIILLQFLKMDI